MLEKLMVHTIAATLANAAMAGAVDQNPAPDPELTDGETRGRTAEVWELHRSFYHAIIRTIEGDGAKDWPVPHIQLSGVLSSIAEAVTPVLAGQGAIGAVVAPVVSALVSKLLTKATVATTPATATAVPDPSQLK